MQARAVIDMPTKMTGYPDDAKIYCGNFGTTPVSPVYQLVKDSVLIDDTVTKFYEMNNIDIDSSQVGHAEYNCHHLLASIVI